MCKSATLKTYLCERKETNPTEMVEYVMKKFLKDEYEERQKIHESDMQVSKFPFFPFLYWVHKWNLPTLIHTNATLINTNV